jgi:short-subunit dehydrogenase
MVRSIQGRRFLITGASRGIGRCLAEQAVAEGALVALVARNPERLDLVLQSLSGRAGRALAVPGDVTREEDRECALERVRKEFGGLDVLVNNAGTGSFGHFADSSEQILRQVMEVNFFSHAELMRRAVPLLQEGNEPAIINVASMCGRRGLPAWTEYSASKFALCGLTEALRAEFARFDIDVLLVLPGLTRTGLADHLLRNAGRMKIDFKDGMLPELVADRILRALKRNRSEIVIGREARLMLLLNQLLPRLMDYLLARKVRQLYAAEPAR